MKTQIQNARKGDWLLFDRRYLRIRKIRTFYDQRLGVLVTKFKLKGHPIRAFRATEVMEVSRKTPPTRMSAREAADLTDEAISKGLETMLVELGMVTRASEMTPVEKGEEEILESFSQDVSSKEEKKPVHSHAFIISELDKYRGRWEAEKTRREELEKLNSILRIEVQENVTTIIGLRGKVLRERESLEGIKDYIKQIFL